MSEIVVVVIVMTLASMLLPEVRRGIFLAIAVPTIMTAVVIVVAAEFLLGDG